MRVSHRLHSLDDDALFLVSTETGQVHTRCTHACHSTLDAALGDTWLYSIPPDT